MLRAAVTALALLPVAAPAAAGPWPRGQGHGFVSVAYEATTDFSEPRLTTSKTALPYRSYGYGTIYAEYGLTDWLTVGFDAGQEDAPDTRQWVLFAALPLTPADWRLKISAELGAGRQEYPPDKSDYYSAHNPGPGREEAVLRPGLLVGYGFTSRFGPGWAAIEARVESRRSRNEDIPKIDTTFGFRPTERTTVFLQAQYSDYPGADPKLRLVPTWVAEIRPGISLETAVLYDAKGGDRTGIRAGIWYQW